jgi:protein-S-isoprenylcysteine O-methyltransferase Ste14
LTREPGWDLPSVEETCAVFADAFLRAVGFSVLMNRKVRRETIRRPIAAVGSALFFLVGPGVFVGLIPWLLTGWQVREPLPYYYWAPMRVLGLILLVAGVLVLVQAFMRFVVEGFGTPAPIAAPERLVVGGVYRYVRNPMYVAILAAIVGQALLLGQLTLLLFAAAIWLIAAAFVRFYEEPTLTRRFGADYEAYRRAVPAWWPRLRPWKPGERDDPGGAR